MTKDKQKAINSQAFAHLKSYLHPTVRVTDAYVENRWLVLQLDNGIRFKTYND